MCYTAIENEEKYEAIEVDDQPEELEEKHKGRPLINQRRNKKEQVV